MLNHRMTAILRELIAAETPITSEYLANVIEVTSRTIRNDIKELEDVIAKYGTSIKSIRGSGYSLEVHDEELFRKLLQEVLDEQASNNNEIPELPEERVQYIIKRLLLERDYVKLEDLADDLYISKSTIQNDLKDVKRIFNSYGIVLDKKPNYGLKIKGDEVQLRFCISEYLFDRKLTNRDVESKNISILSNDEMQLIRATILEQIKENNINLSDIGLNNLSIHIAIACRRIRNNNYVSMAPEDLEKIINEKEYEVAKKIILQIEDALEVTFPAVEIAYIAIHLLGTKTIAQSNLSDKEVLSIIDEDIARLTFSILEAIDEKFILDIKDDKELFISLSLHLRPTINRYKYGMNIRNPMLNEIKANYPIAFEAGLLAGTILEKNIGVTINENEVGYLALHISAAMERSKLNHKVKRCIVVCASGIGSAMLLKYKLQSEFGSKLTVLGTTEYYKLKDTSLHEIDFIVSTIPIEDHLPIPVIEVNTILGESDFQKIEKIMSDSEVNKLEYTREDLVFLQMKFETRDEVLEFLTNQLKKKALIDDDFYSAILEREALSPTSFGNFVAIPHPITPKTDSTFWAICTLQKPIDWGGKRVQFVCLLCVERDSKSDFKKMYELLIKVIDSEKLVQQIIKCKTYHEFIQIFKSIS